MLLAQKTYGMSTQLPNGTVEPCSSHTHPFGSLAACQRLPSSRLDTSENQLAASGTDFERRIGAGLPREAAPHSAKSSPWAGDWEHRTGAQAESRPGSVSGQLETLLVRQNAAETNLRNDWGDHQRSIGGLFRTKNFRNENCVDWLVSMQELPRR